MPRSVYDAQAKRPGPFPEMGTLLSGWDSAMQFRKLTSVMSDGEIIKTETDYPFTGVFEPMQARDLIAKPEGQRAWTWWTLWTRIDYDINLDDDIQDYNGKIFKVMKQKNWNQAGYFEFELVEDYQENP